MAAGIRVDYSADSYSIVTRDEAGTVREVEYSGDEVYTYVSENGLLETRYEEGDSVDLFEYSFDTSALFPLTPWSSQSGHQITLDASGNETESLPFSWHTRGEISYRIGECRYRAMAVQTYYQNPDEKSLVEFVYLLDLGVPLVVGYGGPGYYDPYKPVSIRVVSE